MRLKVHIPQKGLMNSLSANFSPCITDIQYTVNKMEAIIAAYPTFPFRVSIPMGAPNKTNIMQAKGMENFLCISTQYRCIRLILHSSLLLARSI